MKGDDSLRHPSRGVALPDADKPGAYGWFQALSLGGRVV